MVPRRKCATGFVAKSRVFLTPPSSRLRFDRKHCNVATDFDYHQPYVLAAQLYVKRKRIQSSSSGSSASLEVESRKLSIMLIAGASQSEMIWCLPRNLSSGSGGSI